jgi:hypothetical protein
MFKKVFVFFIFLNLFLFQMVYNFPRGPPLKACKSMVPHHFNQPLKNNPPYTIDIKKTNVTSQYSSLYLTILKDNFYFNQL